MRETLSVREMLEDVVDPSHTALLVIDVQNDFCEANCQAMLPRLERVIAAAREAGVYVVYIQNVMLADGGSEPPAQVARKRKLQMRAETTVEGTWGQQIVEQVAPRASEPIVRKHRMNCFFGTSLDLLLRCRGIETIICTGVATQGCVLNTAYGAIAQDYYAVVVDDCVATKDAELHELALRLMRSSVHHVVPSDELLAVWRAAGR
jgi:nicotinamidase-related amidase